MMDLSGGGLGLYLAILITLIFAKKSEFLKRYKKRLFVVLLCAILIPSVVGALKKLTHMPCPSQLIHFDGKFPDVKFFDSYKPNFEDKKHARCFPAGHATMGFSLMSFYFLFRKRKDKFIAISIGALLGLATGGYKMAIGDHFLSHTITTMLLSWLIILITVKTIFLTKRNYKINKQKNNFLIFILL